MFIGLWQDVRGAIRLMLKQPGFTAATILTLALGIGANAAIFSVINAVLLRQPPFKDPDRLVYVWETSTNTGEQSIVSPLDFGDWRRQSHSFEQLSAFRTWFYTLSGDTEPEQVWGVRTSANFFHLLGVQPLLGRSFLPDEEHPGRDRVVLLSYGLWTRRFGADQDLIGRQITINADEFTVIGILPPDFDLFGSRRPYDLWMPYDFEQGEAKRDDYSLIVFGRLRLDTTLANAQAEMDTIADRLAREYPATNQNRKTRVVTLQENQASRLRPALRVQLAAAGLVLLIACVNVVNLMLSRAASRIKEIAIRLALGAGQFRINRLILVESMIPAICGGAVGLLLAEQGLRILRSVLSASGVDEIPRANWIIVDTTLLVFTLALSISAGLLFGMMQTFHISRSDLSRALNQSGRNTGNGIQSRRLRNGLLTAEVSLATILLIGAALAITSLRKLSEVNPGFDAEGVLTMQVWLPEANYPDASRVAAFYEQAIQRIRSLGVVRSASAINFLPMSGWGDSASFAVRDQAGEHNREDLIAQYRVIDPDYFRTMKIPLVQGREFSYQDGSETQRVAIINKTMAQRLWPGENPLGKLLRPTFPRTTTPWRPASTDDWLTIVGVVEDVAQFSLTDHPPAEFYLPLRQNPSALMRLVIRSDVSQESLLPQIREQILLVDENQPITEIKRMRDVLAESGFRRRLSVSLLGIFASLALGLAGVGVYGVVSYGVAQRTREIGIRMALGATSIAVQKLIVGQVMVRTLLGVTIGLGAAPALARLLAGLLYGVGPVEPVALTTSILLVTGVSMFACYLPARRAATIDPAVILRSE
jgi:putative ABC transport system permease protein